MRYGTGTLAAPAAVLAALALAVVCARSTKAPEGVLFKDDLAYLEANTGVVVLSSADGQSRVAVSPALQGRVLTSTASGPDGPSLGWINREAIAKGAINPHMNAFGGEDRFWLGPEGGQFSIFFKEKDPFDLEHWFTPPPVNSEAFAVVSQSTDRITFRQPMTVRNYSGTEFSVDVDREIRLLDRSAVASLGLGVPEGIRMAAFSSDNSIRNAGDAPWTKEAGVLSIWILGMFNPSPETTIVVPFRRGPVAELGPIVNDDYFGKVPSDRLIVDKEAGLLFFKGDGQFRSKIGVPPGRAKPFAASYDPTRGILTIVHFTIPGNVLEYVNSKWEIQDNPFAGDVVNSYNDGPASPGAESLGSFYELESSSPAAFLAPGESLGHVHTTMHFQGPEAALDKIAHAALGVGLDRVKAAFAPGK